MSRKRFTKEDCIAYATRHGVSGADLARAWGHSRQWLYSPRKTTLPDVYRWALIPTVDFLKEKD